MLKIGFKKFVYGKKKVAVINVQIHIIYVTNIIKFHTRLYIKFNTHENNF